MPFVSLIIPVYNAEKYLRRCLTSAMEQTFKDMEILVVNDGSTDESLAICREYAQMDPRFHIINKENTGVSDSRNRAIQIAKGDYLQFMDSDDWLTPDATETFVYAAQKFNCDLVIADFYRVDKAVFTGKQHIRERGLLTREQFATYMMQDPADFYYGVLWNKLYRRQVIADNHLEMDAQMRWCEDFLFNLSFIRHAETFTAIQTPVYYYMKRKGSLVSTDWKKANAVLLKFRLLKEYKELYQSIGLYEENELKINAFVLSVAKDGNVAIPMSRNRKKLDKEDYIEDQLPPGYTRVKHSFDPVYDADCRLLILGSFPSVKSREENFYYGHPQNRFWRVLAAVLGEEVPQSVPEKKAMLLRHRIALWDVLAECEITGASDSSIRNPVANDLSVILDHAPVQAVFTTGATAWKLYTRLQKPHTGIEAVRLPSTSPANCAVKMEALTEAYKAILPWLEPDA